MQKYLNKEMKQQKAWKPCHPKISMAPFNQLLQNEFLTPAIHEKRQLVNLRRLVAFAKSQVPYYQKLFQENNISPEEIKTLNDFQSIPILTKSILQHQNKKLCAQQLPSGHKIVSVKKSSGTTGKPVSVYHTQQSSHFFPLLKQREYRWFRFDPRGVLASIRLPGQLPAHNDQPIDLSQTLEMDGWPQLGKIFRTGPFYGYSVMNDVEEQIKWLEQIKPDYMISYSETLEHLAFAGTSQEFLSSIKGLQAISEMLSDDMGRRIKRAFDAPVFQNYGLNEVGIVASKCIEGGRYHVHNEYCHVEIVNDQDKPCQPGEQGRIIVTNTLNTAMPLIRYDTDDMAIVTKGLCPCGKTLPSFGEIVGRYSRIAFLPENTLPRAGIIRQALEDVPLKFSGPLRKFQIYHDKSENFTLRLVTAGNLDPAFAKFIYDMWQENIGPSGPALKIEECQSLDAGPSGKFQDFISDFMPSATARGS